MVADDNNLTIAPNGGVIILPDDRGITNLPDVDICYPSSPGAASSWSDCVCVCSGGSSSGE